MEFSGNTEFVINEDSDTKCGRSRKERIIAIVLLVVAFIILVVGVVLIAVASTKNDAKSASTSTTMEPQQNSVPTKESGSSSTVSTKSGSTPTVAPTKSALHTCAFSEEAQNVGLGEFLGRVKSTYYKLHPYDVVHDPDATADRIKREYVAYDPTPSTIKNRTDTAQALLKEIKGQKHQDRPAEASREEGVGTSKALSSAYVRPALRCQLLRRRLDDGPEFILLAANL